ncbi:MAG: MCE family protein [Deltaproteobacteria bacterium]|jgi:phospholipid/cholesterol/gamma-HCH transport system substrate-binding protein|nr:MCE family protein [Deltaproteobacteria bacterium]
MRETWNAARVGLMVVLGLAVTFAVYRYVDERSATESGYGVYAYFEDVQGLIAKSRVLVAGIPVGYISSIRLDGDKARVDLRIEGDIKLYEDARVTMRSLSLLGERVLVIQPGTPGLPEIPDGGQILTADKGVATDDIMVTVNDIAQSVKKITAQMERAFGTEEAGDRMQSALWNLSDALENIKEVTDEAGPRLVRIMENVELATNDLSEIIHKRRGDIDRGIGEVDDTIASIHRAADQLNAVLADVKEVTGRTARGEGTIGRLTQDEALIDEVEGVAEGLNNFVGGLNRLRTIVELRSEYYALSNAFKTYFSIYLKPREGRYFLVQFVDDPRGSVTVSESIIRQSPPPLFYPNEYRRTEITRSTRLKFSAEFGKTIAFATFRFGIIESTGGLGLDIKVLKDRLEINTDIFNFGRQIWPRIRVRAGFELVKRFWLLAGIDNAANLGRDYFVGLQLRFDDEDLKPLIPLGAVALPR